MKEKIIELLSSHPHTLGELKLILDADVIELTDALNSLVEQGLVVMVRNTYHLPSDFDLIKGKIVTIKSRFSFARVEKMDDDVYIDNEDLNTAYKNDYVFLEKKTNSYPSDEYRVFSIIKRARTTIVGEVKTFYNQKMLITQDVTSDNMSFVIEDEENRLLDGQIVLAAIIKQMKKCAIVEIVDVIGNKNDPGVDISRIILSHDAPLTFPNEVKKEVLDLPVEVKGDFIDRLDLREHNIVTIDGDDAKDFDDAVEVTKNGSLYEVGVHIADVSYYVKEGSALDKEAVNRGTSIYATDRVVPMLPFELSNGICSLNPNVDRLTLSVLFTVDGKGKIIKSQIKPSIIRSHARLTYNYANKIINNEYVEKHFPKEIDEMILSLDEVSKIIRKTRNKNGALNLSSVELKFKVDEKGNVLDVIKCEQGEAEKMIEDLMIKANEIVASTIENKGLPFIYRIHEQPQSKKMESFMTISKNMGYPCDFSSLSVTPKELNAHLEKMDETSLSILNNVLLRSLAKAKYSSENCGHYGLASESYTHFTSPIRRYPDLIVHRLLRKYLFNKDMKTNAVFKDNLSFLAEDTSIKERRAMEIERDVDDLECTKYMAKHIDEDYSGFIVGMTNNGMFVQLENGIEGFVPFQSLEDDFYIFDERFLRAVGKRNKKRYCLGDKIKVKVKEADIETSQITFALLETNNYNKDKFKKHREHRKEWKENARSKGKNHRK